MNLVWIERVIQYKKKKYKRKKVLEVLNHLRL